jgi:hypothetical protein
VGQCPAAGILRIFRNVPAEDTNITLNPFGRIPPGFPVNGKLPGV